MERECLKIEIPLRAPCSSTSAKSAKRSSKIRAEKSPRFLEVRAVDGLIGGVP